MKIVVKTRKLPDYIPPKSIDDLIGRIFTQSGANPLFSNYSNERFRAHWTYSKNPGGNLEYSYIDDPHNSRFPVSSEDKELKRCLDGEYAECSLIKQRK